MEKTPLITYTSESAASYSYRQLQQHLQQLYYEAKQSLWKIAFFLVSFPIVLYLTYSFYPFAMLGSSINSFPITMDTFLDMTLPQKEELFSDWMKEFEIPVYESTALQEAKMNTFFENCELIANHNKAHKEGKKTYTLGMNHFGDLTLDEFNSIYASGYQQEEDEPEMLVKSERRRRMLERETPVGDVPDELDWDEKGYTTRVKTQGHCGACYIFSTLAAVESRCAIKNWPLKDLSVQDELDCLDDQSCVKGFQSHVYKWGLKSNKRGFSPEGDYKDGKYTGLIGMCKDRSKNHVDVLKDWGKISTHLESDTKRELQHGPVSTAICTTEIDWRFVKTGVVRGPSCNGLTHGVTLVGYGEEDGKPFWKIKNSWSTRWGEKGYAKLCRGSDCSDPDDDSPQELDLGFAAILKQLYFPICTDGDSYDSEEEESNGKTFLDALLDDFSSIFGRSRRRGRD